MAAPIPALPAAVPVLARRCVSVIPAHPAKASVRISSRAVSLIMYVPPSSLRPAGELGDEEPPHRLHCGLGQRLRVALGPLEKTAHGLVARGRRLRRAD